MSVATITHVSSEYAVCPVPDDPVPPNVPDPNDLLTADQVAARFHYDKTDRFLAQVHRPTTVPKPLPQPKRIGRRLLWRRGDVDAWIADVFAEQS